MRNEISSKGKLPNYRNNYRGYRNSCINQKPPSKSRTTKLNNCLNKLLNFKNNATNLTSKNNAPNLTLPITIPKNPRKPTNPKIKSSPKSLYKFKSNPHKNLALSHNLVNPQGASSNDRPCNNSERSTWETCLSDISSRYWHKISRLKPCSESLWQS